MSKSRQLAAIMFTDIVGFTTLMGSDEKKTFEILEKNRQFHKPIISTYNGRWIKELGDGVMASFGNVSDAVPCWSLRKFQSDTGLTCLPSIGQINATCAFTTHD